MAAIAVVSTEDDLWSLLEETPAPGASVGRAINTSGWQPQLLYFPHAEVPHTVTPSIARAITGFHNSLSRSSAFLVYGQPNARFLKQEDQELLDIRFLVLGGSDVVEVFGNDIGRLIDGLVSKMSGGQVFESVVLLLILYFSSLIGREWIERAFDEKRRDGEARARTRASDQETERLRIFAAVLQRHPGMKAVSELADQGREQLVRAIAATEGGCVLGTPLTQDQARTILAKQRDNGRGRRMDGHYEVIEIDIDNPDGYMGTIRNVSTNQEISVAINRAQLADSDIETMFAALRQKTTIDAMVNAWMVGDKIASAHILRADLHVDSSSSAPAVAGSTSPPTPAP